MLALVDQVAAHVDDRRHVLDPDRARLDARHAGRARPQDLVGDQRLGARPRRGTGGRGGRGSAAAAPAASRRRWPGRRPCSGRTRCTRTRRAPASSSGRPATRRRRGPRAERSSAATGAAGTCVIASGRSAPRGGSFPKNTLGIAVMMWKCLDSGSRHRKTRTVVQCSHQPTSLTVCADERLRPPSAAATDARSPARSPARCRGCRSRPDGRRRTAARRP